MVRKEMKVPHVTDSSIPFFFFFAGSSFELRIAAHFERTSRRGKPVVAAALHMSEAHPVRQHPLSDGTPKKEQVAGQLVSICSDYFDDKITESIELKEVSVNTDSGGLFSVTYYTALTAMRILREASRRCFFFS